MKVPLGKLTPLGNFLVLMLFPTVLLGIGLLLEKHRLFLPEGYVTPSVSAVALDDPKIRRTMTGSSGTPASFRHLARLNAVDRPGMVFRFEIPDRVWHEYKVSRGAHMPAKLKWEDACLAIGEGPTFRVLVRVHGQGTTLFDRKSFVVNLLSSQQFTDDFRERKLFLLNLAYDPYGFEMRFCFVLAKEMRMFPSYNQFATVYVNGDPQGLYLAVERPEDAIRRTTKGVVSVLRKSTQERWEEKYAAPGVGARDILAKLVSSQRIADHEVQAHRYEELIDLKTYLKWLAFNSLMQNGDNIDELFAFEVRKSKEQMGRLGIVAWDYDDLQEEPAHPRQVHDDPLMWAAEAAIDEQIIRNPVLYSRFTNVLRELLNEHLTEAHLRRTLADVKRVLDSIDTGLSLPEQKQVSSERNLAMQQFEVRLLRRRAELLQLVDAN